MRLLPLLRRAYVALQITHGMFPRLQPLLEQTGCLRLHVAY